MSTYYSWRSASSTSSAPSFYRVFPEEVHLEKTKLKTKEKPVKSKIRDRDIFTVGARVVVIKSPLDHDNLLRRLGTIVWRNLPSVTVEFDEPIDRGHNGGDRGYKNGWKNGHCWNMNSRHLKALTDYGQIISKDLEIKGRNVKGLSISVLLMYSCKKGNEYSIIEFEENVGGHAGDGLGKRGCCWTVLSSFIGRKKTKKEEA